MKRAQDPDLSAAQMQLLWVGNNDKGFAYLRDVLARSGEERLGLDRVRSPEEALQRLNQTTYDLLLCDYKPGDGMALRLLHEIRKDGPRAPIIFLSDHVDRAAIDVAIKAGATDRDGEDAISIAREYDGTIDMMITDVIMPRVIGAKLADRLLLERPGRKVLFVSGYAETTVPRHGAIDVTTRFLQKPFSLKMLAKKIPEVLETPTSAAMASLSAP